MKQIGIIFHPHIHPDEQAEAEQFLKAIVVRPSTGNHPPICEFEGAPMLHPDTGGIYDVSPVWEKLKNGAWALGGFKVMVSPSQYLMGHDLLPLNDMHTARELAFLMLLEMWEQHCKGNPLINYFSEYKASVTTATVSYYAVFTSAEAAKNAVQQGAAKLLSQDQENHDSQQASENIGGCHIEFGEEMILTLALAKSQRTLPKWLKLNTSVTAETGKTLSRFAERVVLCEAQFTPQWFAQDMLKNPLIWDFPEANAYEVFYSELQDALGDDFPIGFQLAPRFPKSIMAKTFNRDTANAYLEKVCEASDKT